MQQVYDAVVLSFGTCPVALFANAGDDLETLRDGLEAHFGFYELCVVGAVALIAATAVGNARAFPGRSTGRAQRRCADDSGSDSA